MFPSMSARGYPTMLEAIGVSFEDEPLLGNFNQKFVKLTQILKHGDIMLRE